RCRRPEAASAAGRRASADARTAERQGGRRPSGTARQLRLVGAAAVLDAIGEARVHLLAAKVEVRLTRMAHRPATHAIVEVEQAGLVGDLGARLCRYQPARRRRWDRRLLVAGALPEKAARTDRNDARRRRLAVRQRLARSLALRRSRRRLVRRFALDRRGGLRGPRLGNGTRLGLLPRRGRLGLVGLDRRRPRLEAEAMRLADHGIARHAAEFVGDLACRGAAFPPLGQRRDTFVGPAHSNSIFIARAERHMVLPASGGTDSRPAWPIKPQSPRPPIPASNRNSLAPTQVPGTGFRP